MKEEPFDKIKTNKKKKKLIVLGLQFFMLFEITFASSSPKTQ